MTVILLILATKTELAEHFDPLGTMVILKQVILRDFPRQTYAVFAICWLVIDQVHPPVVCMGCLRAPKGFRKALQHSYFTCDESHYCQNKCWPDPFQKNRLTKTGGRKAAGQSTSCYCPPPPLPSSKWMSRHGPPDSALGTHGHLYKWTQGTTARRL